MGKRIKQKRDIFLLITIIFLLNCGSSEGPDNQTPDNEVPVAVGIPGSLNSRPGRNRIELSWTANIDSNINSYKIFWNNLKDSISGNIPITDQPGTIRVMLSDLDEGLYQFYVYHYDKNGNPSKAVSSLGHVYGDTYNESLVQRKIISLKRDNSDVVIQWENDEQNRSSLLIEYIHDSGNNRMHTSTPGSSIDRISNVRLDSEMKYKTGYMPAENSLDTFYTDYQSVLLDKKEMFTHPGVINDKPILDGISASALGAERLTAYSELETYISDNHIWDNYPSIVIVNGAGSVSPSSQEFKRGALLAYAYALRWARTGNDADAQKAIKILNGWSSNFEKIEPADNSAIDLTWQPQLVSAWITPTFAAAAEILKTYRLQGDVDSGWYFSDIERFNVFLNKLIGYIDLMIEDIDQQGRRYNNWGASAGYTKMAAGVFLDDKSMYDDGLRVVKMLIPEVIKSTGQVYELCERDCGHPQYSMNAFTYAAEIARIQSDLSVYEANSNRILTGFEWMLQAFTGQVNCRDCTGKYVHSSLEVALSFYKNSASPALRQFAADLRPFALYSPELFLGFTTLTHYKQQ
jgi:hypothetical protein